MAAPLPRSGRPFRFQRAVRAAERLEVPDRPPKCTVSLRWVQAVTLQDVKPPLAFFRRADIANDPIDLDRQAAGAVIERNHGDDTSGGFHGADSLPPPCLGHSVGTVLFDQLVGCFVYPSLRNHVVEVQRTAVGLMLDMDNPPSGGPNDPSQSAARSGGTAYVWPLSLAVRPGSIDLGQRS